MTATCCVYHVISIARVYAILASQLVITAISIHLFGTHPNITAWMRQSHFGPIVPILSLLLSTVAWITMSLSTQARRISPMKWQLLALFTLGEAISVGFVSSFYQYRSVITTMLVTALATTGVSVYTAQQRNSKYDLSQLGATLSSVGLLLVLYGMIQILQSTGILPSGFLPYNEMIYGLVGATVFSGYLAYHTKLITAGKLAKYQMNEKDYVFGASYVYIPLLLHRSLWPRSCSNLHSSFLFQ
jgi:protein lifeguard